MKPHLSIALLLASLLGSSAALAATDDAATGAVPPPVTAAPAAPANAPADLSNNTEALQAGMRRNADRDAFFEARLAALHAGLTLNPDQDRLWPALETAIRDLTILNRGDRGPDADPALDGRLTPGSGTQAFEALKGTATQYEQRGRILAAIADAGTTLYSTLSAEQRGRMPILMRDLTPRRGPFHRLVAALGGDMERGRLTDRGDRGPWMRDDRGDREYRGYEDGDQDRWSDRGRFEPRARWHVGRDPDADD